MPVIGGQGVTLQFVGKAVGWAIVTDPQWAGGADPTGATDSTAAIQAAIDSVNNTTGGTVYFPPGTYLCNTATSGVILLAQNKNLFTLRGAGKSSVIRTTTATATELIRVQTCTRATVADLFLEVSGTANITHALHITTSSPGSAHQVSVDNVVVYNINRTYRYVYDCATTSGSAVVTSATAVFAGGDVGGAVGVNQSTGPLDATILSVATITGTVNNGGTVTTGQTTIPLTAPLAGVPNSAYTIIIGSEIMAVTGGFQTSTLTVTRGYGFAGIGAATHADGSTVTTYQATLSATATVTKQPAVMVVQTPASAVLLNGFSLGTDHAGASNLDIASVIFKACMVSGANSAAWRVGNGTTGNVLANYAIGCEASQCMHALFINGGGLGVRDANFSTNGVDVKIGQYSTQPITLSGIRSEVCGMFYENSTGTGAALPTSLRDVNVTLFYSPDGVPLRHTSNAALTIDTAQFSYQMQGVTTLFSIQGSSSPCYVTGINVVTNGGNPSIWPSGPLVRVIASGGGRINGSGVLVANTDGARVDGAVVRTPTAQTLASNGAVTVDASAGDAKITLQANATSSTVTNPAANQMLAVTFIQDATGGRTYVWPTNCKFAGGTAPSDTTANARSTVTFRYDGTNWNEVGRAVAVV